VASNAAPASRQTANRAGDATALSPDISSIPLFSGAGAARPGRVEACKLCFTTHAQSCQVHLCEMRRRAAFAASFASLAIALACAADTTSSVGKEPTVPTVCTGPRWQVETLSDRLAEQISDQPRATTIEALRRLSTPRKLTAKSPRRAGPERTRYRVEARLVKMERAKDGGVVLVAIDPKTRGKLSTEFPAATCTRRASAEHREQMRKARAALIAACGQPGSTATEIGGSATITGVGFFKPGDRARRVAANGFELHPVVDFRAGKCLLGAG
jgi:hypothetical protein